MNRPAEATNRARLWAPAAAMMFASLISYVDRNTLALLAPTILKETGLSAEQYGWIISAFSVAYMAGNPVWGHLIDRAGVRKGMSISVSLWTVASTVHAFAAGFWSFGAARAALGFFEGATFPGALRTVVETLPARLHARGAALAYSGGSLGAIVTPLIVTPVALAFGWRGAFLFTGFVGAGWLAMWAVVSRRPELRRGAAVAAHKDRPRWNDRRVWSVVFTHAFGALPLGFILYGTSLYLSRQLGLSQAAIGKLLWIPPLGWEAGYFFWGWVVDRRARNVDFRTLLGVLTVLSIPFAFTARMGSVAAVMTVLFFSSAVAAGYIIMAVAQSTRVYSSSHSGQMAGLGAGSWSAVVALVMPVFGRLMDGARWDAAFALAALFPVVGYVAWLWVNRSGSSYTEATTSS